jgi:hypothetical protein
MQKLVFQANRWTKFTLINGETIDEIPELINGDKIQIGQTVFQFNLTSIRDKN